MLKMMNSSHWGFGPIYLKDGLFDEIRNIVEKYKDRVIKEKILPKNFGNRGVECNKPPVSGYLSAQ